MEIKPENLTIPKYPVVTTVDAAGWDRLIVIGDIHGCLEELNTLLKALLLEPGDFVVLTGDLLDRGPRGADVVKIVRHLEKTMDIEAVLGNHDEKHVRYRRHLLRKQADSQYRIPMECPGGDEEEHPYYHNDEQHRAMTDEDVAWLAARPTAVRVVPHSGHPELLVTHAGLIPSRGIYQQTKGIIRNRWLDTVTHDPISSITDEDGAFVQPGHSVAWEDIWEGPEVVVHGHIARKEPLNKPYAIGVDTGCCFGGALTALVYNLKTRDRSFVQTPARATYVQRRTAC